MVKTYLVSYDICDPKRLRRVFKAMRGFGNHVQYSVFCCDLTEKDRVELLGKLEKLIQHDEDQVLIVDLGPTDGRAYAAIESVGRLFTHPERHAIVV